MCVLLGVLKKHGRSLLCTTTVVHDNTVAIQAFWKETRRVNSYRSSSLLCHDSIKTGQKSLYCIYLYTVSSNVISQALFIVNFGGSYCDCFRSAKFSIGLSITFILSLVRLKALLIASVVNTITAFMR